MDERAFRDAEQRMWTSVGVHDVEDERIRLAITGTMLRLQTVGDGPPIVFVHGASNSGVSWSQLVARLDGFRRIVLDRPGCGLSEPLRNTFDDVAALEAWADDFVVDVLDALAIEQASVVSTSFGGYPTLRGAAAHPERIDQIVHLGWSVGAPIGPIPLIMRMSGVRSIGALMTRLPVNERMVRSMFKQIGLRQAVESGKVTPDVVSTFTAMLRHTDTMRNELRAGPRILSLRGMNESILLPDAVLGAVRASTRFIWGDRDPFGDADVARSFSSKVPGAELEIVPGGHAVWIDEPDTVATSVRDFLG